jgi:hypothetical protein
MEWKRIRSIAIFRGIVLAACLSSAEVVCNKQLPLQPLRCVCGNFTDATGEPVQDVMVIVIKDGTDP